MQQYSNNLTDALGNAIPQASVTILNAADASLATLFADKGGSTRIDNPIKGDNLGRFAFYAANGRYNGTATASGIIPVDLGEILLYDRADDPTPSSSSLAASDGATKIGYGSGTVKDALDADAQAISTNTANIATNTADLNALQLADYTALRAYTGPRKSVYVTGYLSSAAPSGIAGMFVRDDSDTTTADNGGTVIVTAGGVRYKRQFDGAVNAAWFAPKGNGITNDTSVFVTADADAAARGVALRIPKPATSYFGNGFAPTTDWLCDPNTIFLNSNRTATGGAAYTFFVVQRDVRVENAIADANRINSVTGTSDIAAGSWNSSNFDAFTGGCAIVIQGGAKPILINCTARNSGGRPAWYIISSSPKLYRCKASGARGQFGDGFYLDGCINPVLEDCVSDDVTRINFCSEDKSAGVKFIRPVATNAHDAGKNYGGTEFNASIWMENTVGSATEDADCDNAIIVGAAGSWVGDPRATESINISGGRSASLQLLTASTDLFDVNITGHKSGQLTYSLAGVQAATIDDCRLIAGGAATKNLNGSISCDGEVGPSRLRVLNSSLQVAGAIDTAAHGHIAFNAKLPHLTVENCKGYDSSGAEVPLMIGGLSPAAVTTGSIKVRNADVAMWGNIYCGALSFDGKYSLTCDNNVNLIAPVYFGPNGAIKTNVVANSNRLFIYKDITVRGKVQNVRLRMIGDSAKSIADFSDAAFEADMNVFTGLLQFSELNWTYVKWTGATFRNTNTVSQANNYWMQSASTAPLWLAASVFTSNTVAYSTMRNATLEQITGFNAVAM